MPKSKMSDMYDPQQETMSTDRRRKYYDERVKWVVKYAYKNSTAIKDKLDKAKIIPAHIRSVRDLEKVPITIKENLIELQKKNPPFGGFLAVPVGKVWKFFYSTGPIFDVIGNSAEFWHRLKKVFHNVGFRKGDVVLITFSYHLIPASWGADEALKQLGVTVIPAGVSNTEDQVEIARKLGVTGYVGTPSFLISIIKSAEKMGFDFRRDFKLRRAAVGGEPLPSSLRDELENSYGVSTFNIFGTADLHWFAYECEKKMGMHIAEEVLLEIVDPEAGRQLNSGEIGEMVVTSFDETYPLIRFGLGDLACLSDEPCPCGRTSSRIVRFAGRVRDVVRVRGRFIYPGDVRKSIDCFSEVSRYQLTVSRPAHRDELTFFIELKQEDINKENLSHSIQESFKKNCVLRIDDIKFVPFGTISTEKIIVDERKWD